MSGTGVAASQALALPSWSTLPQAFFLDAPSGGQRFCLFHAPKSGVPELGRVLFCHPFAEELNTTRRTVARQARALAENGFAVLQIDLLGCGDSSGDFSDATWPDWLADLKLAHAWLSIQQPAQGPLWLWGLRTGALLASDLAAVLPDLVNLLLWQPFATGQQQLQQFLRLHSAGQWLADDQEHTRGQIDKPAQQLTQGQTVYIAGHPLSPLLAQGLAAARLQSPAKQLPGRLVWVEMSGQAVLTPFAQKQSVEWQQAGWKVTTQTVITPSFWQAVDTEAAPEVISVTLAALCTALADSACTANVFSP